MEYMLQFNDKFEINDDQEVLKSIGMLMGLDKGDVHPEDLDTIKRLVPKVFEDFVQRMYHKKTQKCYGKAFCKIKMSFTDSLRTYKYILK